MKLTKNLKLSVLREKDGSDNPVFRAGKGVTAYVETAMEAGDTASLTATDKIISARIALPQQKQGSTDEVNGGAIASEDHIVNIKSEESELKMLLQTTNFWDLITTQTDGSTSIIAAEGLVNSFLLHLEDVVKNIDLVGSYPTKYKIEITKDKPIIQTLNFLSAKQLAGVAVTSHPAASTATKMMRTNLTLLTIDSVLLAALEIEKAEIGVEITYEETEVLNDMYIYSATVKDVKLYVDVEYLDPNHATYTNNWEYLLAQNAIKTATITFTIGTLLVTKALSNMKLVTAKGSDYEEKGPIKYHTRWESSAGTTLT